MHAPSLLLVPLCLECHAYSQSPDRHCVIDQILILRCLVQTAVVPVQVKHLDGHDVTLSSSGITIPGQMQTMKGEGMPLLDQARKHGDMHVTYRVEFPQQLNESQKKCIKELNHAFPVRDDL